MILSRLSLLSRVERLGGCLLIVVAGPSGCAPAEQGQGPGHREQRLALTPAQELSLGRQAYAEILKKSHVIHNGPEVERVRRVGARIQDAANIEPLQREINLHFDPQYF